MEDCSRSQDLDVYLKGIFDLYCGTLNHLAVPSYSHCTPIQVQRFRKSILHFLFFYFKQNPNIPPLRATFAVFCLFVCVCVGGGGEGGGALFSE